MQMGYSSYRKDGSPYCYSGGSPHCPYGSPSGDDPPKVVLWPLGCCKGSCRGVSGDDPPDGGPPDTRGLDDD